jgi:hypothetical protein
MDPTVFATVTATIVASLISSGIAIIVGRRATRYAEISRIDEQIMKLNEITIEYPYLENDSFCEGWSENRELPSPEYMRYDNYCSMVFNLIENLWDHFHGDREKIEDYYGCKEMILRHRQWWACEPENKEGYRKEFRAFIDSYLP